MAESGAHECSLYTYQCIFILCVIVVLELTSKQPVAGIYKQNSNVHAADVIVSINLLLSGPYIHRVVPLQFENVYFFFFFFFFNKILLIVHNISIRI